MKHVTLVTSNNPSYEGCLAAAGYTVTGVPLPALNEEAPRETGAAGGGFAVLELPGAPARMKPFLRACVEQGMRTIALCETCTPEIKELLVGEGVADLLPCGDGPRLAAYLEMIGASSPGDAVRFVALEDSANRIGLMRSIVERFGCSLLPAGSADDFFAELSRGGECWAVANLGAQDFDPGAFVRRWLSCSDHRRVPFIPYKDMREGLFVHEVITGLNRIARVILSPEELYSLLVNVLFRGEIFPLADRLNKSIEFTSFMDFAGDPLSRAFFGLGMEAYSLENLLNHDGYRGLSGTVERLGTAMVKAEGLRWLAMDARSGPTCGPGA